MEKETQTPLGRWMGLPNDWATTTLTEQLANTFQPTRHYWFLLLVSLGIATLGLVTNSVASVIGAMLIAPLMGPIQRIGIGLATGSALLLAHSTVRVIFSILVAVSISALLIYLLPFHDVTNEIRNRTSPQALDLGTALLCGVVASYVTAFHKDEVTTAGISIAISLVPPLATVGFGLGTSDWSIAAGASLLFVTNLAAILLSTSLFFGALGIASAPISEVEDRLIATLPKPPLFARLRSTRGTPRAKLLRFGMPVILILALIGPLWIGLKKVSREVRMRQTIQRILTENLKDEQLLSQKLVLSEDSATLVISIVGEQDQLALLRQKLEAAFISKMPERVELFLNGISDATSIAGKFSQMEERQQLALLAFKASASAAASAPAPQPEPLSVISSRLWTEIQGAITAEWPSATIPLPTDTELRLESDSLELTFIGVNTGLSVDGVELLSRNLSERLSMSVSIIQRKEFEFLFSGGDEELIAAWPAISIAVEQQTRQGGTIALLQRPQENPGKKPSSARAAATALISKELEAHPNRFKEEPGAESWMIRFEAKSPLPTSSPLSQPSSLPN